MDAMPPDDATATNSSRTVDGLALWDAEAADAPRDRLPLVRLDHNERCLIPFTVTVSRATLHYLKFESYQGYVHCNGEGCPPCRVGRQREVRDLLPVYDVLDKVVGVLAIGPDLRPHALRPALTPVLRRVASGAEPILLIIRRDGFKYLVDDQPLADGGDDGAAAIRDFRERFDAGQVDLTSPFQRLANEDLASIPEVRSLLAARGLTV